MRKQTVEPATGGRCQLIKLGTRHPVGRRRQPVGRATIKATCWNGRRLEEEVGGGKSENCKADRSIDVEKRRSAAKYSYRQTMAASWWWWPSTGCLDLVGGPESRGPEFPRPPRSLNRAVEKARPLIQSSGAPILVPNCPLRPRTGSLSPAPLSTGQPAGRPGNRLLVPPGNLFQSRRLEHPGRRHLSLLAAANEATCCSPRPDSPASSRPKQTPAPTGGRRAPRLGHKAA